MTHGEWWPWVQIAACNGMPKDSTWMPLCWHCWQQLMSDHMLKPPCRRQSADLDATILELLVAADGEESEAHLAQLGPGAPLAISQVLGRG